MNVIVGGGGPTEAPPKELPRAQLRSWREHLPKPPPRKLVLVALGAAIFGMGVSLGMVLGHDHGVAIEHHEKHRLREMVFLVMSACATDRKTCEAVIDQLDSL